MKLTSKTLSSIQPREGLVVPPVSSIDLPEKIIQFGTGVLLRGLPDHFISNANNKGIFNGRIVVVKSTSNGATDAFNEQDGLYTLCVRGIENSKKISYNQIVSSISRIVSASSQWNEVLACAANPDIQVVLSNTTEVGIAMVAEQFNGTTPVSFPGKLLAFLYKRFEVFGPEAGKGLVIIPTELITDNAEKLRLIILQHCSEHNFSSEFVEWIKKENHFCNSLVDRIVPGKFSEQERANIEATLGYSDELMIMSESYALWAIETNSPAVEAFLSFKDANPQIILAPDIDKFRDLKLRLLNGAHTFSCGLAMLAGFQTVKDAMSHQLFRSYLQRLMQQEITQVLLSENITNEECIDFCDKVLDRFSNPFIEHPWLNICMNYSSKMLMRNIPLITKYCEKFVQAPVLMSLGMAAHILFMRSEFRDHKYFGRSLSSEYELTDENAPVYYAAWQTGSESVAAIILADRTLWHRDLTTLPTFLNEVNYWLSQLLTVGAVEIINLSSKISVEK